MSCRELLAYGCFLGAPAATRGKIHDVQEAPAATGCETRIPRLGECLPRPESDRVLPSILLSPEKDRVAVFLWRPYASIAEISAPFTTVGGLQISELTGTPRPSSPYTGVELFHLADGDRPQFATSTDHAVWPIGFSPDGRYLAFARTEEHSTHLCVVECETGRLHTPPHAINPALAALAEPLGSWCDHTSLVLPLLDTSTAPRWAGAVPHEATLRTREDRRPWSMESDLEAQRILRHFTSQLAIVDGVGSGIRPLGQPGIYRQANASPDGRYVLVTRCQPVRQVTPDLGRWPTYAEVWDITGAYSDPPVVYRSTLSIVTRRPEYGIPGRWYWHPHEPATIVTVQADGQTDQAVIAVRAPFQGPPHRLLRIHDQCIRFCWTTAGQLLVLEGHRDRERVQLRTISPHHDEGMLIAEHPVAAGADALRGVWRIVAEEAPDELRPVWNHYGAGDGIVAQSGSDLFVTGTRTDGRRAQSFIERLDVTSGLRVRLYTSDPEAYERIVAVLTSDGSALLTTVESRTAPPRYSVLTVPSGRRSMLDSRAPATGLSSQVIRRTVPLSSGPEQGGSVDVYLPPDFSAGTPVPFLIWLYPQIGGGPHNNVYDNEYLPIAAASPLFLLLQGFGVAYRPPVRLSPFDVNPPHAMVDELVEGVTAIADSLITSGLAARAGIGVGGHCLGAYAAALVLARTKLFQAGIVSGGQYNLATTPLGTALTAHRRLWDAPELYLARSPLSTASNISTPLLILHGECDSAYPPREGRDLFSAVAASGGTCRYVGLPREEHVYATQAGLTTSRNEISAWCDRYLKGDRTAVAP